MAYRKIIIGETTYEYTVGREYLKVKGVGVRSFNPIGEKIVSVKPSDVKNFILETLASKA